MEKAPPGYYGGCEFVDGVEQLAIDRVKALFGAEYANVQPHSGATANAATMHALLNPGDTILGLSLAHGGHLTHGMRINFSGKLYHATAYEVSKEDLCRRGFQPIRRRPWRPRSRPRPDSRPRLRRSMLAP